MEPTVQKARGGAPGWPSIRAEELSRTKISWVGGWPPVSPLRYPGLGRGCPSIRAKAPLWESD